MRWYSETSAPPARDSSLLLTFGFLHSSFVATSLVLQGLHSYHAAPAGSMWTASEAQELFLSMAVCSCSANRVSWCCRRHRWKGAVLLSIRLLIGYRRLLVSAGTPPAPVCTNQGPRGHSPQSLCGRNHRQPAAPRLSARPARCGCTWWARNEGGQTCINQR